MSRETARYDYTSGSRGNGAIVYDDDQKIQNHDDSNPARGQHSAFDLVRLHRFGHLDEGFDGPIGERPSQKAMIEFAETLPELRKARGDAELVEPAEPANDDSWPPAPAPAPAEAPKVHKFARLRASEFLSMPRPKWIVPGVLPEAELAIVVGAPGAGKTFACLSLACAINQGVKWFGREVQKGTVVYGVFEGVRGFRNRYDAHIRAHGTRPENMPDVIRDVPNLLSLEDAEAFAAAVGKASVCFLDTMSCIHDGDENSGESMGRLLRHVKLIHQRTGALMVLLHHPPHDGGRARGWSGLTGAADAIILVEKQGDYRSASTVKLKDGEEGHLFNFKIRNVELEDGEGAGLIEIVGGEVTRTSKLPKPGSDRRRTYDAVLAKIREANGAIDAKDAQAAAVDSMPEPMPGETDRRLQRANEHIKQFEKDELLFRVDGKISDTQLIKGTDDEGF